MENTTHAVSDATIQGITRRTNQLRAIHLEEIKNLIDLGLSQASIVDHVQRKFGVCRRTAYNDYDYAETERMAEPMDNEPHDVDLSDRDALMRMINTLLISSYQKEDLQGFARLTREYERLARMSGQQYGKP